MYCGSCSSGRVDEESTYPAFQEVDFVLVWWQRATRASFRCYRPAFARQVVASEDRLVEGVVPDVQEWDIKCLKPTAVRGLGNEYHPHRGYK